MEKLAVCLLVSGNLGYSLLDYLSQKDDIILHSVFTDKKSDTIIEFCKKHRFPCFVGNPRENATASFRKELSACPDILLSINYLFLIEDDLISYPLRYAVNVHGSLLPKYRGRTPHVWAIINGEQETGITAHFITKDCDKGAIIAQRRIPIEKDDTGGSILRKYKAVYPELIDDVLIKIRADTVDAIEQDESKATYYPKRTPDDGEIDFNWQRERIFNWIRAMAPPEYPGAFFYDNGTKVIVSRCEFSDIGYSLDCVNGTILYKKNSEYFIKAQNGVVLLKAYFEKHYTNNHGETGRI